MSHIAGNPVNEVEFRLCKGLEKVVIALRDRIWWVDLIASCLYKTSLFFFFPHPPSSLIKFWNEYSGPDPENSSISAQIPSTLRPLLFSLEGLSHSIENASVMCQNGVLYILSFCLKSSLELQCFSLRVCPFSLFVLYIMIASPIILSLWLVLLISLRHWKICQQMLHLTIALGGFINTTVQNCAHNFIKLLSTMTKKYYLLMERVYNFCYFLLRLFFLFFFSFLKILLCFMSSD